MRVLTDCPLPREQILAVNLELPEQALEFRGRVVWEKEQDFQFTHRYICGVEFVEPDEAAAAALRAFIGAFTAQAKGEGPADGAGSPEREAEASPPGGQ